MIIDGGAINCSRKFHNIKLTLGEYFLNSSMFIIQMCGSNVVLGVQILKSLGIVAHNFQKHFMRFSLEGKEFELRGMMGNQVR